MGFTTAPKPIADEQAFESIKAGIDALPAGVKAFLNGG
jgi:pyridoxine 4-dehydrogenase